MRLKIGKTLERTHAEDDTEAPLLLKRTPKGAWLDLGLVTGHKAPCGRSSWHDNEVIAEYSVDVWYCKADMHPDTHPTSDGEYETLSVDTWVRQPSMWRAKRLAEKNGLKRQALYVQVNTPSEAKRLLKEKVLAFIKEKEGQGFEIW